MHSTTLDVTRKQRQFAPFTYFLCVEIWLQTSDVSTQSCFGHFTEDINFLIVSSYEVLLSPLLSNIKYLEDGELMWCSRCHRLRALIFCQTLKRHSLGALGRAWERLRSIFPATGAKLPHPTEPQLPRLAAFQFISVALIYIFELLPIHFHLFQRYIINVFNIFMSPGKNIFTIRIPPPFGHLMECFRREVLTFLLLLSS